MKKQKKLYLTVAILVVAVMALVVITQVLKMQKNENVLKDFLSASLAKTEENEKIYEMLQESSVLLGEGVDEKTQKDSQEKSDKAQEEFAKKYEEYLDSYGMEDFQKYLFPYIVNIHSESDKCEIQDIQIKKDNDYYKFQVTLETDEMEVEVEGRAEIVNGKICKIEITNP